ncbi:oligosaccharide flippase family protein [Candidatus Villigracilis saccharophilus]|uniref:oligosaccharide flippase family protein n=1 Tax=Candidatus Villigracilis saccharophilus TaxID=3140684 RepID=UPI0031372BAD|nr:oligosaccharide flippase family protein [Anaerolineales bacterium]
MKIFDQVEVFLGNSDTKRRMLSGGAWAAAGQVILFFSSISVNMLLARLTTPDELGTYFLALSLVSFASIFALFGLPQVVIQLIGEALARKQWGRVRFAALWVLKIAAASTGIVSCVILILTGWKWNAAQVFHSELINSVIWLFPFWIAFNVFQRLLGEIFRGFNDIKLATILGSLSPKLFMLAILVVIWVSGMHSGYQLIVKATILAGGASTVLGLFLLLRKILPMKDIPLENSGLDLKHILMTSWPLWVTNIILFFLTQADLWIVGGYSSQADVAIYGAASRLLVIVVAPLMLVNAIVPPMIVEMYTLGDIHGLERRLRKIITMVGVPSLFIFIAVFFWSGDILGLIYGEYYRAGARILAILCVGQFFNVWAGSSGLVLILTGHQRLLMAATFLGGGVTVVGSFLLVRYLGATGPALAAASGMIVQNFFMLALVKRKVGIWTHMSVYSLLG